MPGTREGGLKSKAKNLERNPNFYSDIGRIGGKIGTTGGFYANRELASRVGRIGGLKSRRGKAPKKNFIQKVMGIVHG